MTAEPGEVLAKAITRASELLGLSGVALSRVLGVSEATASAVLKGEKTIDPQSKAGELALLLVRMCRSLDALATIAETKEKARLRGPFQLI